LLLISVHAANLRLTIFSVNKKVELKRPQRQRLVKERAALDKSIL
jgi:hypothetical protein